MKITEQILTTYCQAKTWLDADNQKKAAQNARFLNVLAVLAVLSIAMMPALAVAAPWDGVANKILDILNGGLVRTIAIIAVIACGIAAIAGKLSWDWAIKIVIGIVLIFGAAAIVDAISGAAK